MSRPGSVLQTSGTGLSALVMVVREPTGVLCACLLSGERKLNSLMPSKSWQRADYEDRGLPTDIRVVSVVSQATGRVTRKEQHSVCVREEDP